MIVLGRRSPVSWWDQGLYWGPSWHLKQNQDKYPTTQLKQDKYPTTAAFASQPWLISVLSRWALSLRTLETVKEPSRDAHDGFSTGAHSPSLSSHTHTSASCLWMAVSGIDATLFSLHQTASNIHMDETTPVTHWLILLVYKGWQGFCGLC